MTQVLFRRCDGLEAGAPVVLPKGRRRLSAVIKKHADRSRPHIVLVSKRGQVTTGDGQSVRLRKDWPRTVVGPRSTVVIVYLPRGGTAGAAGGAGGGRNKGLAIGLVVGAIALAAVGQFWGIAALNGALGLAATSSVGSAIWAAGTTALLAGGAYLLNKATQAKADKTDDRPTYGVAGGGNQPRSGDRIPVIYGRCWNSPDLSQPDYTTYDGDDQVLYKRVTIGCGRYSVKSIRVSGVTMWTADGGLTPPFAGAAIEVIPPGGSSALVPGSVISVPAVGNNQIPKGPDFPNHAGPFDFGPDALQQTKIQLDYSLPSGCYAIPQGGKFEGKQFPTNWGVLFEYAPCDVDGNITGPWLTLLSDGGYQLSTRPIRVTRFATIPAGRYAVRAQNIGEADTVTHPSGFEAEITNTVMWDGLRSHHAEMIVRPGVTELAMRIRSGKSLGVTSYGDVEIESSRILPVWYGGVTGWVEEETDKAVWAAVDILHNADYAANTPYSEIDLDRFKFYADSLTEFDRFSAVIRGPVSVYDALTTVLGTMRASPLRLGSMWTLVRDEPKAVRKHVISRRQILKDSSGQTFNLDLSDGSSDVIVEWNVDGDPKRRREKRVTFGAQTLTPKRMAATGITDSAHAIHIATWAAACAYYRRERRSLTTELSGRLFLPNDAALIDNWYFDKDKEVTGVFDRDGLTLTVDSEMELPPNPFAVLRARDGLEWGPVAVTQDGDRLLLDAGDVAQAEALSGLLLNQVIGTRTQAATTVVLGTLAEVQDAWLIRAVSFSGDSQVGVEAVYDAPEVWEALAEPIIVPPPPASTGLENDASVSVPWVRARAVQRNGAMFMDWSVGRSTGATLYAVRISYDDWETFEDVFRGPESSGTYPLRETTGTIRIRARGIGASGLLGTEVESSFGIAPAVIDLGNATPGSLQYGAFLEGLEPVAIVEELPDLVGYSGPKMVTLWDAVENKPVLYQLSQDATEWAKQAAGDLLANTVTAAAIQAGAVKASAIDVDYLSAISADLGDITGGSLSINDRFIVDSSGAVTIKNADTGARLVITNSLLQVFDSAGTLRVRLGIWP